MPSLRAVIFDYGKVLSFPPSQQQWQTLSARFGKPVPEFQQHYWGHRDDLDRGVLDEARYWRLVASDCGVSLAEDDIPRLIDLDNTQWTTIDPAMLSFSRDLRAAGYKTAILSNMTPGMLAAMRRKLDWLDEFAVQIYSCEIGVVKPEEAIYRLCCERLCCPPSEALFLDDKAVNVEGAKRVGIQSYVYHSAVDPVMQTGEPEITLAELREMLLSGK